MLKTLILALIGIALAAGGWLYYWSGQPLTASDQAAIPFEVKAGSNLHTTAQQIAQAGVPINELAFSLLARFSGKASKFKAGNYELKPGTTPWRLIDQLVRGEFAQESLVIIEGWTFHQMRLAIAQHTGLRHDTVQWTDQQILEQVAPDYKQAEGLFFPDTYLFAKGASDLQLYKQAFLQLQKRLNDGWQKRDPDTPYKSPYEALIMASIIEKETGQKSERNMIAGVFTNRLRKGMLLQTDPTVIYGMGDKYQGQIHKRDLLTDTPYNTYTRGGLPPTPIALPGAASLAAALNPARTQALYFVSRNDGTSQFSNSLEDHNRAVNQYQR